VRVTTLATNMQSGELDPTLRGQKDLDAYKNGVKRGRNVQRRATGGLEKRGGFEDLAGHVARTRYEAFEFSADQRYVVGFSDARVEVRDLDGNLLVAITGAPWDAATMWEMTTSQAGDVMVITHTGFWPKVLTRTGLTTFTLGDFAFDKAPDGKRVYQPYYKFVDPAVTVTPSAATGAITLTAKDAAGNPVNVFNASHVGLRLRVYDAEVLVTGIASGSVLNAAVQDKLTGKLDLDPYKTKKGSSVVEVLHLFHGLSSGAQMTFSGSNDCGSIPANFFDGSRAVTVLDEHRYSMTLTGVTYNYWEDTTGSGTPSSHPYTAARLSEDGGGPNVEFSVGSTPTRAWLEPSFSAVVGYPGSVCFHEGRLWFGGSTSQPDGAWGSNALQFFRFDSGKGYDADSVQVATGTEDVSRTQHLISCGELVVMNANGESAFIVRDGEPITPSNARIKGQSTAGCSSVQPCVFDSAVIFTQANGLSVYEMAWSQSEGGYVTVPISTLASHLIRTPTSIAATPGTTSRVEQMCFLTNSDGTVAVFHSERRDNVAGWLLWELGGEAEAVSVTTIGPNVYVCVFVRGAYRMWRYSDAIWLDGAVRHTNLTPKTDWVLDARVRNRVVDLVSEKGYHGQVAVDASGVIALDIEVAELQAGDGFLPLIETLPPSVALSTGPQDGKIKRTVRSITDFGDDSCAVTVNDCPIDTLTSLDDWAGAIRPVTSPHEMHHLGLDRDPTVTFSQSAPVPGWRVLSVLQEVAI
jgi:hypothetical protein